MNLIFKFLLTGLFLLNFTIYSGFGQKYSLYGSKTLRDCLDNPAQGMFDPKEKKSFALGGNFMTFNFSQNMYGPHSRNLSHFLMHEKMSFDKKDYPISEKMNYVTNDFLYEPFVIRFRLHKLTQLEFTYAFQIKGENQFSFSDNLVNTLLIGSGPYKGDTLFGAFNTNTYSTAYMKITYGLRRNITDKIYVGLNYHRYIGMYDVRNEITASTFYTNPNYQNNFASMEGTYSTFYNYQDTTFQKFFKDYWKQKGLGSGLPVAAKNTVKTALLNHLGKSGGRGISFGAGYDINEKLTTTVSMRDWAKLKWSDKSVQYKYKLDSAYFGLFTLGYDTSLKILPVIDTSMIFLKDDKAKTWRYIDSLVFANVTDTNAGSYKTNLPLAFEIGASYKWFDWYTSSLTISKYYYMPNYQFNLINRFKAWRSIYFNVTVGIGTYGHTEAGAQMMIKNKWMEFYVGSEQWMNWYLKSMQLGADFNWGLVFIL